MQPPKILALSLVLISSSLWCRAEVVQSAPQGFAVRSTVSVPRTPDEAYAAFVGKIGSWWESSHTFFGDASNLSIELRAQGCFCERAPSGREVRHLTVVFIEPGKLIRMSGGLGPLQDQAVTGVMTVEFRPGTEATEVVMTYRASGFLPDGLDSWAGPVDSVLGGQLVRYQRFVATGSPDESTQE